MKVRTDDPSMRRFYFYSCCGRVCTEAVSASCAKRALARLSGPGLVIMGVTKDLVKAGDGKTFPKTGDELTMHYTGWLARTETKFDSSVDKGKPFVFKVRAF